MSAIGVLALQGDFAAHQHKLHELDATTRQVRTVDDLRGIRGLVIPGGESSVFLRLLAPDLKERLRAVIADGLPTLATCAGVILLADQVSNPEQESLRVLHVNVKRNGYGRQVDSFVDPELTWTTAGKKVLSGAKLECPDTVEGVFIRAPIIEDLKPSVEVLIKRESGPVFVKQKKILALTFHPELSGNQIIHQLFLGEC